MASNSENELDELFGALDGKIDESSVPNSKRQRLDGPTATVEPGKSLAPVGDFSKLMNHVTLTHENKNKASIVQPTTKARPAADLEKKEKAQEISTGTSHDKSVRQYSAFPAGWVVNPTVEEAKEPAKTYPFPLDPFQKQAISYIQQNQSVLVAAHTSAGKTAVAEYAIARCLRDNQKCVYTSPIKALSNQKFRDLQEEFTDVGLMTGDITINPDATCLVMTTEILRSMLYRGSELLRQVAFVIYDEVHYMRDKERGVVWEESIILLPDAVRFVFLSATIPNANEFCDWICELHRQPCHVVYTNYRPTPLQHYVFPAAAEGLFLVVDEKGKFRQTNFQKAMACLQTVDQAAANSMMESGNAKKMKGKNKKQQTGANRDLHRIVQLIMQRQLDPVIVFSFSKKDCESYALALNQEDFTDEVEKDLIGQVYENAIEALSEDDRKLPQVEALLPLLKRGIGIHHGGLLPILKEIVEILFSEGLIKILFATETFSIGINMPAKTVVFTNTRKWDGKDFRWVTASEYIQMSGRAGRRGKDDRGIVIQMLDERMEPEICRNILYGAPDPLNSSYRISYNMLLNLLRVEDVDPEYLLRSSFLQFQQEREAPALLEQAVEWEKEAEAITVAPTPEVSDLVSQFYNMDQQLAKTRKQITMRMREPQYVVKFLSRGRLINISVGEDNAYGWGILVSHKRKNAKKSVGPRQPPTYNLDVVLPCVERHLDAKSATTKVKAEDAENSKLLWSGTVSDCRPATDDDDPSHVSFRIFTVTLDSVERLSAIKVVIPTDCTTAQARSKVGDLLGQAQKRFQGDFQLLDPVKDLGIKDDSFQVLLQQAEILANRIQDHQLSTDHSETDRKVMVQSYDDKMSKLAQAKVLRDEARNHQSIIMKDDMKRMKRALRKLGHVDANSVIQTKGRTACEINTAHELVVVELMFTGVFNDLTTEQCVALLSCMIYDEKIKGDDPGLNAVLSRPFFKLQEVARAVAKIEVACGMEQNEEEFVAKCNPGMMEAVYAWCKGAKFVQVQELTNSFEGTTIRTLRRLEELVRQVAIASKAIGNNELQKKFEQGSELIKRDIVFCSSLYL